MPDIPKATRHAPVYEADGKLYELIPQSEALENTNAVRIDIGESERTPKWAVQFGTVYYPGKDEIKT